MRFWALALAGCAGKEDGADTGGASKDPACADNDGDGFQPCGELGDVDCDEVDAGIHPGATEICDGVDNDCDGLIDDGVTTTYYADADGDGFGDSEAKKLACEMPDGYVPIGNDCDDANAQAFPGNLETCDEADDDCDGDIDEADAEDAVTWYEDLDFDGYGNASAWVTTCDPPSGYVSDASDCDDTDPRVHPAADEICNDGTDDDCDGLADDADLDVLATTYSSFYADADADGYGLDSPSVEACDAPSGYAAASGDCDDATVTTHPTATEDCNAVDDDCSGIVDDGGLCPCDVDWTGGHAYLLCSSAETWSAARAECEDYGYLLVTLNDATENSWVANAAATYAVGTAWTGLTDEIVEGSFGWLSGQSYDWSNWASGEPNDLGGEDAMVLTSDGTWNDSAVGNAYGYVCEDL